MDDIPQGSPFDSCDHNVQRYFSRPENEPIICNYLSQIDLFFHCFRLEMLWQEELRNKGPSSASFSHAVWRFVRTRIIADCLVFSVTCILGFLTPVSNLKISLTFLEFTVLLSCPQYLHYCIVSSDDLHAEAVRICSRP